MSKPIIDQADIKDWQDRFNKALANQEWNHTSPATSRSWTHGFFSCLTPPDLGLLTCCLPCITFGKTHHRLRKNGNMEGYELINTSCIGFWLSGCIPGASCTMQAMQMQNIREKHNLEGSCMVDMLKSCCCMCCSLVQSEKESKEHAGEKMVMKQYANEGMVMTAQQ